MERMKRVVGVGGLAVLWLGFAAVTLCLGGERIGTPGGRVRELAKMTQSAEIVTQARAAKTGAADARKKAKAEKLKAGGKNNVQELRIVISNSTEQIEMLAAQVEALAAQVEALAGR